MNPAESYILNQVEPFKSILLEVQVIIETTIPEATLLYKWRIPCYYIEKTPICYFNVTKGYVDIAFWGAQYFIENVSYLNSDKRKYIKSLRYTKREEVNHDVLLSMLQQAYEHRGKKIITG